MKKSYISPSIITVIISQTAMIAISNTNVDGLGRGGTTSDAGITEGAAKSNSFSVWDDDWSD
jgi:hypothetical protein